MVPTEMGKPLSLVPVGTHRSQLLHGRPEVPATGHESEGLGVWKVRKGRGAAAGQSCLPCS